MKAKLPTTLNFLLAALIIAGFFVTTEASPLYAVAFLLSLFACAAPFLIEGRDSQRRLDLVSPGPFFALVFLLYFPLNSLKHLDSEHVVGATFLSMAGIMAFFAGYYYIKRPPPLEPVAPRDAAQLPLNWVLIAYGMGLVGTYLSITTGNFLGQYRAEDINISPYLGVLTLLRFQGFILLCAALFCRERVAWTPVVILLLIELSLAFLTTSKQLVVYPVLALLIAWNYTRERVPARWFALTGLAVFPILVVTYAIREVWFVYISSQHQVLEGAWALAQITPELIAGLRIDDIWALATNVFDRFHGTESLVRIMERGDRLPLQYEEYQGLAYLGKLLVPRFIWPDKPEATYQIMFGHEYFDVPHGLDVLIPPTQIGVMYLDYGVPGVLIWQVLMGVFVATFYNWFRNALHHRAWLVGLYTLFLIEALKIETNPFELLSSSVKTAVTMYLLYQLAKVLERHRTAPASGKPVPASRPDQLGTVGPTQAPGNPPVLPPG